MSSNISEAAKLSNLANPSRRKNHGRDVGKRTDDSRSSSRKKRTYTQQQMRVARALKSASSARRRHLGRNLTPEEWSRLKAAVKKQCRSVSQDTVSRSLRDIFRRLVALENVNPSGAQALSDSIGMFAMQVSTLREQALRHLIEHDELRPTCGHFRHKKVVAISHGSGARFFKKLPNLGYVGYQPNDRIESLACASCTKIREDSVFLWSGSEFDNFEEFSDSSPMPQPVIKACGLQGVHPLSIQEVWSSVLQLKYGGME